MIELYNHGMSVCAAKVRMALEEKGLRWENNYIDIRKAECKTPQYLKINPNGNVPTLVHDGYVVYESTIINEYINDTFPEPPLMPADATGRARVRKWTIQLDVSVHMATRVLSSSIAFRHSHLEKTPEELEAKLSSMEPIKRERQRLSYTKGLDSPYVKDAVLRYDKLIRDMEEELAKGGPWLAGEDFSLAECGYASYFTALQNLQLSGLWRDRPKFTDWFERIKKRPTYKKAIVDWFISDYTTQMKEKGAEAWPRIKAMLGGD